jgi:hypothetical protein
MNPSILRQMPRTRTPAWASREWFVYRQQYCVGNIKWDEKRKCYTFLADRGQTFDSAELFSEVRRRRRVRRLLFVHDGLRQGRKAGMDKGFS